MESPAARLETLPPWLAMDAARDVLAALGGQARFVGGCVRDALRGEAPADLDLATPLPPAQVAAALEAAGLKAVPTGIAHGTVTAVARGRTFEITTLRRDVATDGRHATVEFTDDWRADAARRDFTINAMSLAPDGAVYDYFGGREDLASGRVRFVGDAATRIREDVLRCLRFFRFHARYASGEPDADGLAACRELAPLLPGLSAERVAAELFRLLEGPRAAATLALMREAGALAHWLPEADAGAPLARLEALVAATGSAPSAVRALALLLPRESVRAVAARLKLSNDVSDRLERLAHPPVAVDPAAGPPARRALLYRLGDDPADAVLLAWARAASDAGFAGLRDAARRRGRARGGNRPRAGDGRVAQATRGIMDRLWRGREPGGTAGAAQTDVRLNH
jgi:poly(A) polymerase